MVIPELIAGSVFVRVFEAESVRDAESGADDHEGSHVAEEIAEQLGVATVFVSHPSLQGEESESRT